MELLKAPIDAAVSVAHFALTPVRVGTNIAINTADAVFGLWTEDIPTSGTKLDHSQSVYGLASSNLDIAASIYYYTELRSSVRALLKELAVAKKLSIVCTSGVPSDVLILWNAVHLMKEKLKIIESSSDKATESAIAEYKDSVQELETLRQKYQLTKGDMDVIRTYFDILSQPKAATTIKSDLVLYNNFISPLFQAGFGGADFNLQKVINMVDHDDTMYIHKIDDEFANTSLDPSGFINGFSSQIVWAIVVSDKTKRITVVFRGSVNANDWMTNINVNMTDFMLPGFTDDRNTDDRHNFGRVHEGFYNYLFGKTEAGFNGSTKSKAEEIIGILKADFFYNDSDDKYKDYSLFVTGHSLGGALSTMFAVRAAAFGEFDGRVVTNISFASPFVGSQEFRDKFYELEQCKRIHHLRISNHQDMVTLIPNATLPLPSFDLYKHVGMNIRLYDDILLHPAYRLFYPKKGSMPSELRNSMHANIFLGFSAGMIAKHMCPEYVERLNITEAKNNLEKVSLEELYACKEITGWSYAH